MIIKFLSPKPFLSPTSPFRLSILITAHFSSSSSFSNSSSSVSHSSAKRHYDDESRKVRVSVWWDFENCQVPAGANVFKIANTITDAVRGCGIKGPVTITAFGDVLQLSRPNQEALSATGINLSHVPKCGKNTADRLLLMDLMIWVSQNPPPAHVFLISGDRDFASILHRLRMNNYNILLASQESTPAVLCSAASIMWDWRALVKGETLAGKYFKQPPDGPYGSWYGHYKVALEDPFAVTEQPSQVHREELAETDSELRPVSKAVVKQIRQFLSVNPKGVSGLEIRKHLGRTSVSVPKDLYGYRDFSQFLLSIPHILNLGSGTDEVWTLVHKTNAPEPIESSPGVTSELIRDPKSSKPMNLNGDDASSNGAVQPLKLNGDDASSNGTVQPLKLNGDDKLSNSKSELNLSWEEITEEPKQDPPLSDKNVKLGVGFPQSKAQELLLTDEKDAEGVNAQVCKEKLVAQKSAYEFGFLENLARFWHGPNHGHKQSNESHNTFKKQTVEPHYTQTTDQVTEPISILPSSLTSTESGKDMSDAYEFGFVKELTRFWYGPNHGHKEGNESNNNFEKENSEQCDAQSTVKVTKPVSKPPSSLSSIESGKDMKIDNGGGQNESAVVRNFFNKTLNIYKSWRHGSDACESIHQPNKSVNLMNSSFTKYEAFRPDSFWIGMEVFIRSPKGSLLCSQSSTREEMAQKLLKEGPLSLRSLDKKAILHLVDMLISDKKWVEESPFQNLPFKVIKLAGEVSDSENSSNVDGLQSLYLGSKSHSQEQIGKDGEKIIQNVGHVQCSEPISIKKKASEMSRSDIIADCGKLAKEITEKYPEGYNIGLFRKDFAEKYGYRLNTEKLGYQKLQSLLQIVPGVKIESGYILSADSKDIITQLGGNSDSEMSKKDDLESESAWQELGPISEPQSASSRAKVKQSFDYEPALSEDELSDSEEESHIPDQTVENKKPDRGGSALLQILNSWDASVDKKQRSDGIDDSTKLSSNINTKVTSESNGQGQKLRQSRKKYSFVSDKVGNKDKMIDDILGSLKKSSNLEIKGSRY